MAIAIIVTIFAVMMTIKRMINRGQIPGFRPCLYAVIPAMMIPIVLTSVHEIRKAMLPVPRFLIPQIPASDVYLFPEPQDTHEYRDRMAFAIASRIFFHETEHAVAAPIQRLESLQHEQRIQYRERCCIDCLRRHHVSGMLQRAVDNEFGIEGWRPTGLTTDLVKTLERRRIAPTEIRRFIQRVAHWASRYANRTIMRRFTNFSRPTCHNCNDYDQVHGNFGCKFNHGQKHASNPLYQDLMRSLRYLHTMNRDLNPRDSCEQRFGTSYDECVQYLQTIRMYQRMQRRWGWLDRRTGEHEIRETLLRIAQTCANQSACLMLQYLYWRYADTWYRLVLGTADKIATMAIAGHFHLKI